MPLDPGLYAPCLLNGRSNWDGQGESAAKPYHRLVLVEEGRHRVSAGPRKGTAGPGRVYHLPPATACTITAHRRSRAKLMAFTVAATATAAVGRDPAGLARAMLTDEPQPPAEEVWGCSFPLVLDEAICAPLAEVIGHITVTWWLDPVHRLRADNALANLLHRLVLHHLPAVPRPEAVVTGDLIADVLDLVGSQLPRLRSSRDLAAFVRVSPDHLNRRFREATGETASAYLKRMRLIEAARILRSTDEPVEEVAKMVGFRDASALGRSWRRRHGVSPTRWRRAHR